MMRLPTLAVMLDRAPLPTALLWSLCWLCCPPTSAATVADLEAASVPVTDTSAAELERGTRAAFAQVMVKLTGDSRIPGRPEARPLQGKAASYNTLYGYERDEEGGLLLRAEFDLSALGQALRALGLPVWGRERPEGEAWLVLVRAGRPQFAPDDEASREIYAELSRQFVERGLLVKVAIRNPLVTVPEPLAADPTRLLEALLAVPGEMPIRLAAVLSAETATGPWQLAWQVLAETDLHRGETTGELPLPVLRRGIDAALDAASARFTAVTADPAGNAGFSLAVAGVTDPEAYARVVTYLEALDALSSVRLVGVNRDVLRFEVVAHGGSQALTRTIGYGQVLEADAGGANRYRVRRPP